MLSPNLPKTHIRCGWGGVGWGGLGCGGGKSIVGGGGTGLTQLLIESLHLPKTQSWLESTVVGDPTFGDESKSASNLKAVGWGRVGWGGVGGGVS